MVRRFQRRRGVVLLVVLTLLTLLIVIGLTFAVLSGQFRRAAEANAAQERYSDEPSKVLDRVIYQLVRDTVPQSPSRMMGHSLLRDLYGSDGVAGQVVSWVPQAGAEFLEINFTALPLANQPFSNSFRAQAGYYNGCPLTVLGPTYSYGADGQPGRAGVDDNGAGGVDDPGELGWPGSDDIPLVAESARVVRYDPVTDASGNVLSGTVMVEWSTGEGLMRALPRPGSIFLINGRPFNGTGAGYDPSSHELDATTTLPPGGTTPEIALLPNYSYYGAAATIPPNAGGLDESWDAPDYQNMFLAMVPADATAGLLPSFHRPELVNFWLKRFGQQVLATSGVTDVRLQVLAFRNPAGPDGIIGTTDDPLDDTNNPINPTVLQQIVELKRRIILRPLPEDHPNFVNNSRFVATMGLPDNATLPAGMRLSLPDMVWDVDNDGDGVPDSIWMDVGFPVQTDASGRRYRPLVAILCQDLDGRLNLNAHSSPAHNSNLYADLAGWPANVALMPSPANGTAPFANNGLPPGGAQSLLVPRGLGYGPADIFLGHLLGPTDLVTVLSQRYRHDITVSGNAGGASDVDDALSLIKNLGVPRDYASMRSAFGMPPDIWGRGGIGMDYSGQPVVFYMGEAGETVGDPYEIVLNRKAAEYNDSPFTLSELERILRYNDADAQSLPNRLLNNTLNSLVGDTLTARKNRRLVTTHSSHLPVASGAVPVDRRSDVASVAQDNTHSILDLYRAKLLNGGVSAANVDLEMLKMVPPEIWHGQRFNVNRLLGNGRDDNGNDVVDEPLEADGVEAVWPDTNPDLPGGYDGGSTPVPFNYLNDDPLISVNRFAPQIYARHLYCLMMLLTERVGAGGFIHPTEESLSPAAQAELTAHRIAQWAINVVDFRDADAIMTPFEYDVDPFDGWLPMEGDPSTIEGPQRRLVWGTEYPDLLLTETVAMHNRNVKDTAHDRSGEGLRKPQSDPTPHDDDLDQYRIPQGSLFLEVFCTRNHATNPRYTRDPKPTNANFPRELYDENGLLDLGRLAPADMSGFRAPVWRVVISEPLNESDSPDSPLERSERLTGTGKPDSTSFNPVLHATGDPTFSYNMDLLTSLLGQPPAAEDQILPERFVWFTPQAPPNAGEGLATFYCRNFALGPNAANDQPRESFVKLAPGSYAVVGPRMLTRVGAGDDADVNTFWDPSPHRLLLTSNTFRMIDNDGVDRYTPLLSGGYPIRNPLGIICAALPPSTWVEPALINPGIGLNVSEPLPQNNYYEEPTDIYDAEVGIPDGYDDPDPANRVAPGQFPDEPFDNLAGRPLADNNMQHTGTTLDYKAAFLQRLANPLEPFHVTRNPYVTVDWSTIDLTVFNGEDEREKSGYGSGDPFDPYDDPDDDAGQPVLFSTRQRGGEATFPGATPPTYGPYLATTPDFQLWSPKTQEPFETQEVPNPVTDTSTGRTLNYYFQHNLLHSLGYLNGTMGAPLPAAVVTSLPADIQGVYLGAPQRPFPWLTFHNRPYANPLELMQVPSSTASRLLHEFEVYRDTNGMQRATVDPYDVASSGTPEALINFRGTFRHLLNFFHTSRTSSGNRRGGDFYRLFDFVETPSPFVGAEKWYAPQVMRVLADSSAMTFRPPYNHLSRFQDPGRVNINTIFDPEVWEGVVKGYPAHDPTRWGLEMTERIFLSRRGYGAPGTPWLAMNSDYPTFFGNPFRAADSADLMPNVPDTPNPPYEPRLRKNEPVQATLLREDLLTDRTQALFIPDESVVPTALEAYQNQDRNSFFRYHGPARLSNLVSNHSNVFAVWVTVGYFEVEANPGGIDPAHPDGLRLGPELGTDAGAIKRHRGFYIIDRSVPVAFEPGENHNVDHCILLRRFIE